MTLVERWAYVLAVICYAPLPPSPPPSLQAPVTSHEPATRTRTVISQPLPKLDGDNLRVQTVQVHYGPGESSQSHSHPCPVIVYVIEGSVRMQVQDPKDTQPGPIKIYRSGESFYEAPNGRHLISANASDTEAATFLATFICDHTTPLSVPDHSSKGDTHR
jgi:quercetin dioxygenase-like cupin family protein